ncbi:Nitrogen fixation regulation protein FixK [compost metagenome]
MEGVRDMSKLALVNDDQVGAFVQQLRLWRIQRRPGQSLYHEGDPAEFVYRVDKGWVRLLLDGEDGLRRIFAFVGPGDYFGANLQERDCTAEACTDLQLTVIPVAGLLRIGRTDPVALLELFEACTKHYRERVEVGRGQPSAAEKLRAFIARMGERITSGGRSGICLPFSQVNLANYLGVAPETLCRAAVQLCERGELARHGRRLWIGGCPPPPPENRKASQGTWGLRRRPCLVTQESSNADQAIGG